MTRASRHSSLSDMMRTDSEGSDYSESNVRSSKRRHGSATQRRGASGRTRQTQSKISNRKRKRTRRDQYEDEVGDDDNDDDDDDGDYDHDHDMEYEEDYVSAAPLEDIAEVEGEGEGQEEEGEEEEGRRRNSNQRQKSRAESEQYGDEQAEDAFDDNTSVARSTRSTRRTLRRAVISQPRRPSQLNGNQNQKQSEAPPTRRSLRNMVKGRTTRYTEDDSEFEGGDVEGGARRFLTRGRRSGEGDGKDDDFKPNPELEEEEEEEEDIPVSEPSIDSPSKNNDSTRNNHTVGDYPYESGYNYSPPRTRLRPRKRQSPDRLFATERDELAQEVRDLRRTRKAEPDDAGFEAKHPRRRTRKNVDYRVYKPELVDLDENEDDAVLNESPSKRRGAGANAFHKNLFPTFGPFGGGGGPTPLFGGAQNPETLGGIDSDSSDDDIANRPKQGNAFSGAAAAAGVVTTDALAQNANNPGTLGKIKDRKALADLDPLGVDQNINFDSVGGLGNHILKLKEMVSLPLLYPEVFTQFKIVPPRGVLFHGPPGTGKTLLARALASDVSSGGRKVTFYMRKGADILSKWLGEAERQLRLLFEEARKSQPSIIFFDEIDGLAPVRSSKQEQIHASIVSTLLALMDGMDGRGQVIVIGATNRPDSVDPALRRPGRFDREFYFGLPNIEARRAILDIHTKGWTPPLPEAVKDELAKRSKGYGGADLRALCTEAALNAVQRKYPQIYRSSEKLLIDPATIQVTPQDFMLSLKTIVPSSERSASSGAGPLPRLIEPLLGHYLKEIIARLKETLPPQRNATALEVAEYEDSPVASGFEREELLQAFDTSCCMRPRLLIHGRAGMGQQYLTAAVLNHLEGTYIQSFDLATLLGDSARSTEAAVIQLFTEAKRHKPSIIYMPDVSRWHDTISPTTLSTFYSLVNSLLPSDPILILGVLEYPKTLEEDSITQAIFPLHDDDRFYLDEPKDSWRHEFFQTVMDLIRKPAVEFPDLENRKKRVLESLPVAPPEDDKAVEPSKEELKAQRKKDRQILNMLKIRLQPMMDHIKLKYKRFRAGVIDDSRIAYLFDDDNPGVVTSDVPPVDQAASRPFEKSVDRHGVPGLRETATGRFFYNLDVVTIERRLANGYYKRPKDFYSDIKRVAKDSREIPDQERQLKASELLSNVSVEIAALEAIDPAFVAECEGVFEREVERNKIALEKAQQAAVEKEKERERAEIDTTMPPPQPIVPDSSPRHHQPQQQTEDPTDDPSQVAVGESSSASAQQDKNATSPRSSDKKNTSQNETSGSHESLPHSNTVPDSHHDTPPTGDVVMTNSEETPTNGISSGGGGSGGDDGRSSAAQSRPGNVYSASSRHTQFQLGVADLPQKDSVTPMVHGSQPGDYTNDASTTQSKTGSGQKHTPSNGDSYPAAAGGGGGNAPGNDSNPNPTTTQQPQPPAPAPVLPPTQSHTDYSSEHSAHQIHAAGSSYDIGDLHITVALETRGLSVAQLEWVNSKLMKCVWRMRGESNRSVVADAVGQVFAQIMGDVRGQEQEPAAAAAA